MWSSPRWTTARWTASPGACCPPTTWAAPRPTWTPTRFPPTSTRCSRRPRPAARRSSSSTAPRRRSRRTPISCVTPPSAACACSAPATEGTLRTGWVELLPAGVAPALGTASPSEAPWENEPARVADDDEGPTHWRRCHKCKLFFDKEEIIELGGYCPGLRHPAAPALRRAPGRHGGRRLVRGVERGHARLQPAGLPGLPGEDRRSAREEWP